MHSAETLLVSPPVGGTGSRDATETTTMTMTITSSSSANQLALLNIFIEAGCPLVLWGEPGTAKSANVESAARALARLCETVIASLREPADFGGLPVIVADGVRLVAPAWAKRLAASKRGLLFLDEANLAALATEGAMMRVVNDGVVGEEVLGAHVSIVMACNPPECSAGGRDMSAPFANRAGHIDWQPDADSWITGMLGNFPPVEARIAPEGWEERIPEMQAIVAAYIQKKPDALHRLPAAGEAVRGWPSRRSWTNTARVLACAASLGYDVRSPLAASVVAALVGSAAAQGFITWLHTQDLVDPEEALANPTTIAIPTRGDRVVAFVGAVTAKALAKGSRSPEERAARYAAAGVVLGRVIDAGHADLVVPSAGVLAKGREAAWPIPASFVKILPLIKLAA